MIFSIDKCTAGEYLFDAVDHMNMVRISLPYAS